MVRLSALCLSALLGAASLVGASRKVEVALNTAWRDHHLLLEILSVARVLPLRASRGPLVLSELSSLTFSPPPLAALQRADGAPQPRVATAPAVCARPARRLPGRPVVHAGPPRPHALAPARLHPGGRDPALGPRSRRAGDSAARRGVPQAARRARKRVRGRLRRVGRVGRPARVRRGGAARCPPQRRDRLDDAHAVSPVRHRQLVCVRRGAKRRRC